MRIVVEAVLIGVKFVLKVVRAVLIVVKSNYRCLKQSKLLLLSKYVIKNAMPSG